MAEYRIVAENVTISLIGEMDEDQQFETLKEMDIRLYDTGWTWASSEDTHLMGLARIALMRDAGQRKDIEIELDSVLPYSVFLKYIQPQWNEEIDGLLYVVTGDNQIWYFHEIDTYDNVQAEVDYLIKILVAKNIFPSFKEAEKFMKNLTINLELDYDYLQEIVFKSLFADAATMVKRGSSFYDLFADIREFANDAIETLWETVYAEDVFDADVWLEAQEDEFGEAVLQAWEALGIKKSYVTFPKREGLGEFIEKLARETMEILGG